MISFTRSRARLLALAVTLSAVSTAFAAPPQPPAPAPVPAPAAVPGPDADMLLASVRTAKLAAEAARDAAHTAAEGAQQASAGRKQALSDASAQRAAVEKHMRAAEAAYRAFATKAAVAPAQPKADEALAAAIAAYQEAKKSADELLVAAVANNSGEEQAMANLTTLDGQIAAVVVSIKQASVAAKTLATRARKESELAERAKQASDDIKAALAAVAAAKKDVAAVARDLRLGAAAAFAARKQKNAAELTKLQAKVATVTAAFADLGALQALGSAKGSCDLRRVDFRNAAFPTFKLKNGTGVVRSEGGRNATYLHTSYGDLDGDNSAEAFVAIESTARQATQAAIGHADASTNYYVFGTDAKCKLKSIGTIPGAPGTEGRVAGNAFVVGTHSHRLVNGALVEGGK